MMDYIHLNIHLCLLFNLRPSYFILLILLFFPYSSHPSYLHPLSPHPPSLHPSFLPLFFSSFSPSSFSPSSFSSTVFSSPITLILLLSILFLPMLLLLNRFLSCKMALHYTLCLKHLNPSRHKCLRYLCAQSHLLYP